MFSSAVGGGVHQDRERRDKVRTMIMLLLLAIGATIALGGILGSEVER